MDQDGYFTIELPGVGIVECPYKNVNNKEIAPKGEFTGGWEGIPRPGLRVFAILDVGHGSPKKGTGNDPYSVYIKHSGKKVEEIQQAMIAEGACNKTDEPEEMALRHMRWDSGHETGHHDKSRDAWKHPLCVGERRTKTAIVIGRVIRKTGEGWSHPMRRG